MNRDLQTAEKVLQDLRALLSEEGRWTQGWPCDADGRGVDDPRHPSVTRWTVLGGFSYVTGVTEREATALVISQADFISMINIGQEEAREVWARYPALRLAGQALAETAKTLQSVYATNQSYWWTTPVRCGRAANKPPDHKGLLAWLDAAQVRLSRGEFKELDDPVGRIIDELFPR